MKDFSTDELKSIYTKRKAALTEYMVESNICATVFIDNEEHRDASINYLTGYASDAVLIIFTDGFTILIPWDENLAKNNCIYDKLIPFTRYKNDTILAVKNVLNIGYIHGINSKVELPPYLTYPNYLHFIDELHNYDCKCSENGSHKIIEQKRMIKDEYEIECIKEAARIGDLIIDEIEEKVKSNEIKTEIDVALLIERRCREYGAEKTGFDTLAAGPSRSFAIHAFPGYTNAEWPSDGLSILDFGVVYKGYTSDTTLTIAKGELSPEQEKLLSLVQNAYDEGLKYYIKDKTISDAAKHVDSIFAKAKRKMPHSLGHAIGLNIHEAPRVSPKTSYMTFQQNMVLTLEPGLYDPALGGCRLENDILITNEGNEVLSHSRIIRV